MKKWIIWILLIMFILTLPVVLIYYDHARSEKMYDECMTWDGATEEECLPYLD